MAFVNESQSFGNYVTDTDGNVLLDLSSMENLPLGHNHPAMVKAMHSKSWDSFLINAGVTADTHATVEFATQVKKNLLSIAPNGLPAVTLTDGRNACEKAIYEAMAQRGHKNTSALGFGGSYHGDSLVVTQFAHPNISLSSVNWPVVEYPTNDGSKALEEVRSALKARRQAGKPVSAVVIEPTNWHTGQVADNAFIN